MLTVSLSHDAQDFQNLREEWEKLQERNASDNAFLTWDWLYTWWEHYGNEYELWLLQAREAEQLVGIAPLMASKRQIMPLLSWKEIGFVASPEPFDHLDFLIDRGKEHSVLSAFVSCLKEESSRWNVIRFDKIPEYSPHIDILHSLIPTLVDLEQQAHTCPAIELPPDWEAYLKSLSKGKREQTRRQRRKVDKQFGDSFKWDIVTDSSELSATIDTLVAYHQSAWTEKGERGAFYSEEKIKFYKAAARALLSSGRLRLYRIFIEDRVVGVSYNLEFGGRQMYYSSGIDDSDATLSLGHLLHAVMIEDAINRGISWYDFLWGDERYKFRWGAVGFIDRTMIWTKHLVASAYYRLYMLAKKLRNKGKSLTESD